MRNEATARMITGLAAVAVLVAGLARPAAAADSLADLGPLSTEDLADRAGGTLVSGTHLMTQANQASSDARNEGNALINSGPDARITNGAISSVSLAGNRGMSAVLQNTGNQVNMNYTMNVNIYLQ